MYLIGIDGGAGGAQSMAGSLAGRKRCRTFGLPEGPVSRDEERFIPCFTPAELELARPSQRFVEIEQRGARAIDGPIPVLSYGVGPRIQSLSQAALAEASSPVRNATCYCGRPTPERTPVGAEHCARRPSLQQGFNVYGAASVSLRCENPILEAL